MALEDYILIHIYIYLYIYMYIFTILVTWRLKYNKINNNMVYTKGIYNK